MKRRNDNRRKSGERYALLPLEVLTSDACRLLPAFALRILVAMAAQYSGWNNGDLALTWSMARAYGINSKVQLNSGIDLLLERGLIQKTRQGGKKPFGPCLYALTWRGIDELRPKIDSGPTTFPSNAWVQWKESEETQRKRLKKSQQKKRAASAQRNSAQRPNNGIRLASSPAPQHHPASPDLARARMSDASLCL